MDENINTIQKPLQRMKKKNATKKKHRFSRWSAMTKASAWAWDNHNVLISVFNQA